MLRWFSLLASVAVFSSFWPGPPGSAWREVTAQDLALDSSAIGDPDADAAILFREGELNDNDPEGTSLKLYVRIKIFTEQGRRYADIRLPYRSDLGKITDLSARTVKTDGSEVQVADRDIYDNVVMKTARGVWREKAFSMPAARPGSIIEYRYRQRYPQGFRYFALDLQSDLFIKSLLYKIRPQTASPLDVRWITFNAGDPGRFTPVWDGTYNIKADNIPPFRREPLMPPEQTVKMWGWLYYSNETEKDPEKYWRNYARLMHQRTSHETRPTNTIRRVVDSITHSSDNPTKKLERIYDYVQSEITNSTLELREPPDEASRQNDNADETIRKRRGTTRDINRLFVAMARAAGVDARVAELTTRDENFFNRSFSDSFQLNSEITAVIAADGSVDFYDPGTPRCPFGVLSWEKEAVPALLFGKEAHRFVETPVNPAHANLERRSLFVSPRPDGSIDVRSEMSLHGQRAIQLRSELDSLDEREQRKLLVDRLKQVHPAAAIDEQSVKILDVNKSTRPVLFNSSFVAPRFASLTETRLLLRPALLSRMDRSFFTAPTRVNKLYFQFPWSEEESARIEVPDGYSIERVPDTVEIDIGAARYRASFRLERGRILYERSLAVNAIIIGVEQYAALKEFFDRVHHADRGAVSFRR